MTRQKQEARNGYIFVSPWFIGFVLFLLYPLVASLCYSFCDYSVLKTPVFTGLDNFIRLFHDDVFWTCVKNTAYFCAIFLPASLVLSLGLAMLLNTKVWGMSIYRTIFYLPSLLPLVATACVFLWVFDSKGVVNSVLQMIHIHGPDWLASTAWSKITIIMLISGTTCSPSKRVLGRRGRCSAFLGPRLRTERRSRRWASSCDGMHTVMGTTRPRSIGRLRA